jgi:hypothetical protein
MGWYRTGTIQVTTSSTAIVGTGTTWMNAVKQSDLLTIDGSKFYEIASVNNNTSITLATNYLETSGSGKSYAIINNLSLTANTVLASNINALLDIWQTREGQISNWASGTVNGGPNGNGTYPITTDLGDTIFIESPAKMASRQPGVVYSTRTSNILLNTGDYSKLIDYTANTFTQNFVTAATLLSGWYCIVRNSGNGTITLDPSGSEQINGATTLAVSPGETWLVQCTGTAFNAVPLGVTTTLFTRDLLKAANATAARATLDFPASNPSEDLVKLAYGMAEAISKAGQANRNYDRTLTYHTQSGTATVTQSASSAHFRNYASVAVTLPKPFLTTDYQVVVEAAAAAPFLGAEGQIIVSARATNGFVLLITGSATSATLRWKVIHPNAK